MIWMIFLLPVLTFAQVDIFGYYESEYDYLQLQNSDYNFGYNKLRLDLESRLSDQVMIAGNINFQLYYGKTEWDFFYKTYKRRRNFFYFFLNFQLTERKIKIFIKNKFHFFV